MHYTPGTTSQLREELPRSKAVFLAKPGRALIPSELNVWSWRPKTSHEEASRMPLLRPSHCCPLCEGLQAITVFPRKSKELPRIKVGGFFAKKCFEPPLKIRAPPGLQAVAARGDPVVSQRCPHENQNETGFRILRARPIRRAAPRDAHAPGPTTCRAFPKYLCSGPPRRCFSRLSSSP